MLHWSQGALSWLTFSWIALLLAGIKYFNEKKWSNWSKLKTEKVEVGEKVEAGGNL